MLGTMEKALGLREWLEERGHTLIATSDKDGSDCELERHLPDTDVLITTVRSSPIPTQPDSAPSPLGPPARAHAAMDGEEAQCCMQCCVRVWLIACEAHGCSSVAAQVDAVQSSVMFMRSTSRHNNAVNSSWCQCAMLCAAVLAGVHAQRSIRQGFQAEAGPDW